MAAYGYGRGSTAKQVITLEVQTETIQQYAKLKMPAETFGGMFVDPATSGSIPFADRPAGGVLNQRLETGDHVIFAKLDRGFRNWSDFAAMLTAWDQRGVLLHAIDYGADSRSAVGRMILGILATIAEFERTRIAERTAEAKARAKAKGWPVNGHAGLGFKWVGQGPGRPKRRMEDAEERKVMRWILKSRLEGATWHEMWAHLLQHKIKTRGRKEWSIGRIRRAYLQELRLSAAEEQKRLSCTTSAES